MEEKLPVTFALFCYNHELFIREAVEAALSQTYSPLEIYISDDCSTDKSFEIIQDIISQYKGSHNVILNRNSKNLGWPEHLHHVFRNTTGELIIMAAGDDISLPERSTILVQEWVNSGKKSGISSLYYKINHQGNKIGEADIGFIKSGRNIISTYNSKSSFKPEQISQIAILGATAAWSRDLWNKFGPISNNAINEDFVFAFRSCMHKGLSFTSKELVAYRIHNSNMWSKQTNQSLTIKNIRSSIDDRLRMKLNGLISAQCSLIDLNKTNKLDQNTFHIRKHIEQTIDLHYHTVTWWTLPIWKKLQIILSGQKIHMGRFPANLLPKRLYIYITFIYKYLKTIIKNIIKQPLHEKKHRHHSRNSS